MTSFFERATLCLSEALANENADDKNSSTQRSWYQMAYSYFLAAYRFEQSDAIRKGLCDSCQGLTKYGNKEDMIWLGMQSCSDKFAFNCSPAKPQ